MKKIRPHALHKPTSVVALAAAIMNEGSERSVEIKARRLWSEPVLYT
ncbi:hypothetical protein [Mesorhizobium sp. 1B3]